MDIKKRVGELAEAVGLDCPKDHLEPNQCWIDGKSCPYGQPYGQLELRPAAFCIAKSAPNTRGCGKAYDAIDSLNGVIPIISEEATIENFFESSDTTLSGRLREVAQRFDDDIPKRLALELAADIIRGRTEVDDADIG